MLVLTHVMHSYAYTQSASFIGTDRSCVTHQNTSTAEGQLTKSNCSRCRGWLLRGLQGMKVLGVLATLSNCAPLPQLCVMYGGHGLSACAAGPPGLAMAD
jgi:hypothetical protein